MRSSSLEDRRSESELPSDPTFSTGRVSATLAHTVGTTSVQKSPRSTSDEGPFERLIPHYRYEWRPRDQKLEFVVPGEDGTSELRKTIHDRPEWMAPFFNIFETYDNNIDSRAVRVANADQPRGRIPRLIPDMSSPRAHILFARCIHLDSLLRSMADAPELA